MEVAVEEVSKRYGPHWALARLSLRIGSGEAVMLAGHNGSGKTTLLRMLAGALQPTLGDVRIGSSSLKADRDIARRHTALLSHASGHYDDLSATDNLAVHARLLGRAPHATAEALARVGLADRAETPVREFSAGMKKRLGIARVMLKAPAVILLDEPFGELDPQAMAMVETWIRAEKANGRTLVMATHWLEQGTRLTDRAIHLHAGRVADAAPEASAATNASLP